MSLIFEKTQKGAPLLLLNEFSFHKYHNYKDNCYWRCTQYRNHCTAKCVTADEKLVSESGVHDHPADAADIEKRKRIDAIKNSAKNSIVNPSQIVAEASANLPKSVAAIIPSTTLLTRIIRRTRNISAAVPRNPNNLFDLQIPSSYTKTIAGHDFLLFDSGPSANRILLFSTDQNLRMLSQCEHWYLDGTFKSSPPLFKRIFSVHGTKSQRTMPLAYGLLPNKEEYSYTRFLAALNGLAQTMQIRLNPHSILTDFEFGCLNGISAVFPTAEKRGCYFHHAQCIWKHVQAIPNVLAKYNSDPEFALHVRQLPAIAFVPAQAVAASFDILINTPFYIQNEEMLRPLIDYFGDTWIGRLRHGGRRQPLFEHALWNCFQSTASGIPRTNNAVEGWHRRFNTLIGKSHPSIWALIETLKQEQSVTEMKLSQILAGTPFQTRRKKYRDLEVRLLNVIQEYGNIPDSEYLLAVAHNIGFYD